MYDIEHYTPVASAVNEEQAGWAGLRRDCSGGWDYAWLLGPRAPCDCARLPPSLAVCTFPLPRSHGTCVTERGLHGDCVHAAQQGRPAARPAATARVSTGRASRPVAQMQTRRHRAALPFWPLSQRVKGLPHRQAGLQRRVGWAEVGARPLATPRARSAAVNQRHRHPPPARVGRAHRFRTSC
jgi:hypothetical protein